MAAQKIMVNGQPQKVYYDTRKDEFYYIENGVRKVYTPPKAGK